MKSIVINPNKSREIRFLKNNDPNLAELSSLIGTFSIGRKDVLPACGIGLQKAFK